MKLPRINLFEFEDLTWLPKAFRRYITDLLTFQIVKFGIYESAAPLISDVLKKTGHHTLVDLCSGSGGPAFGVRKKISEEIGEDIHLFLTDKFPNIEAFSDNQDRLVTPILDSVDASKVNSSLKGMRTMFTAFHHFTPEKAKEILQDAKNANMPIAIFEITERNPGSLMTLLVAPITCLIFSLLVKPRKIGRFFWTYLIPFVPLMYTWDGLISNLRSYTKDELRQMTQELEGENFNWTVGELTSKFHLKITYLIGYPNKEEVLG